MAGVLAVAVEREPRAQRAGPRLDPEQELGVGEGASFVIEEHVVAVIAVREVHAGGDEQVGPAVGVEIGGARTPGPSGLGVRRVRPLGEPVIPLGGEEGIAEDVVAVGAEEARRKHDRPVVLAPLVLRAQLARHVGVHVGHEQVETAVAVPVENHSTHRAPRRGGKDLPSAPLEAAAAEVAPQLIVSLHRQDVEIGTAVGVVVERDRVARPGGVPQPRLLGCLLEAAAARVPEKEGGLAPLRVQVAGEGVGEGDPQSVGAALVPGVAPDAGHEQIEVAVAVGVEEDRPRGVLAVPAHAGRRRDIGEARAAVIAEEQVAGADGGHVQVRIAIAVDVGERSRPDRRRPRRRSR